MNALSHARLCDGIGRQSEQLARALSRLSPDSPVAGCPGWTAAHLAVHVNAAFVWAAGLVGSGVDEFRPPHVFLSGIPEGAVDPTEPWPRYVDALTQAYLRAGMARRLEEEGLGAPVTEAAGLFVGALRRSGPDAPAWTPFGEHRVRFWTAWGLMESGVHRTDAEATLGIEPEFDPEEAEQVVDFWLTAVAQPSAAPFFDPLLAGLRRSGERILFETDGASPSGVRRWQVHLSPSGPVLLGPGEAGRPDAVVRAPGGLLLRLLKNRVPVTAEGVRVSGATGLVEHWLRHVLS